MKQYLANTIQVLCVALLAAAVLFVINPIQRISEGAITVQDLVRMIAEDAVLIIDARPNTAYEQAHIPNALNLDDDDWERSLSNILDVWQNNAIIVVYCDSTQCATSDQIANQLKNDLGIEEIYTLQGGWEAWQKTPR